MQEILDTLSLTKSEVVGILIMTVVIYVYWRLFAALVVNKFVALYEARESLTTASHEASDKLIETANELEREVQHSLDQARAKISADRIQKIEAAKEAANKTVAEADAFSENLMHENRQELDNEYQIAKQQIASNSDSLSRALADKVKSSTIMGILVVIILLINANAVFAESGGHHHGEPTIDGLIPYAVNFLLYVGILFYFVRKPVVEGWKNRKADIAAQIEAGQIERKRAEEKLQAARSRFESINVLLATLTEESTAAISSETQAILKDARDRAGRIREQGQAMVLAEKNSMRKKFRKELADAVIAKATATLKKETSAENDKNSRMKTIDSVGALIN